MSRLGGVLLVDKPGGMTSFDVVRRVGRVLGTRRAGHCGTLDPMATGLMLVCWGWSTRLVPWLTSDRKRYVARVRLGARTSTDDAEGEVLATAPVPMRDRDELDRDLDAFRGSFSQVPPRVSAVHVDGKRAHALARQGVAFEIAPRDVEVHRLDLLAWEGTELTIDVDVSKGTYIRSIARDLGDALGCGGHLTALRRTHSGIYSVDDAIALDALDESVARARSVSAWDALAALPAIEVDAAGLRALRVGQRPEISHDAVGIHRVCDASGELLAIVRAEPKAGGGGSRLVPERLVPEA